MKNDNILIAKFLRNEMDEVEKEQFARKMKNEAEFKEQVQVQMALHKALKKKEEEKINAMADIAIENLEKKKKRQARIITLYSAVSVAAAIALVLFIVNPFKASQVNTYIAMAENPAALRIEKIRNIRTPEKDSLSIFKKCKDIMIAAVPDKKLESSYFFDGCTLYTFFQSSVPVKVLIDYDKDLNKVYFICKDSTLFKLTTVENIEEKEMYVLEIVEDSRLNQLCK